MELILDKLKALEDSDYAEFQMKLIPGMDRDRIIGVRVPLARKLAKQLLKEESAAVAEFLAEVPHEYYDEYILHAIIISELKDDDDIYRELQRFLPYVDNWAVCDIMAPKRLAKNPKRLLEAIRGWAASEEPYTARFGMEMLMTFFLDERFSEDYLEIPLEVTATGYYVDMMKAWFYATALAKQWKSAINIVTDRRLDAWTHNKTIQKACESYRITTEQKVQLRKLKIK